MATQTQRSSPAVARTEDDGSMARMSFLQHIRGHVGIIKDAAEKATQLESEADSTLAAAAYLEERAFCLVKSRNELESVTQQIKGREKYLMARFGRENGLFELSESLPVASSDLPQDLGDAHLRSDENEILPDQSRDHPLDNKSVDIIELRQDVTRLQAQLETADIQHTKSQRRNQKHVRELSNLRNVAEDGKYYKQESIAMQKKLEHEQRKTNTLQHEVSRLRGMVDGLRDGEIRHLREERETLQLSKTPNISMKQKDLQGVYKQVVRWSRGEYPLQPSEDSKPLIANDVGMCTFSHPSLVLSRNKEPFTDSESSAHVKVHQPRGLFPRTRSKLKSRSAKPSVSSNASHPQSSEREHRSHPTLPVPDLKPHWTHQCTSTAPVKIRISNDFERQNNILSPYVKSELFSDPTKRECIIDLAMLWQTKLHQAPRCLYVSYKAKSGEWSAKERREGQACRNCREGTWWPEDVLIQCIKLNSRIEVEVLNPRPWDMERQEIYDRANWARGMGASLEEIEKIEEEMLGLGEVGRSVFGLQMA